jgi:hypothetical protein
MKTKKEDILVKYKILRNQVRLETRKAAKKPKNFGVMLTIREELRPILMI